MKEIAIFGAYCNTKEKLAALERSVTQAKDLGLDVLVFARYPVPEYIQIQCDYYIFDKSNPVLTDRALNHWLMVHGRRVNNWFQDYGFAALEQITKSLGFVKSLNYDIAYWLVYDVDLTNFQPFRSQCLELIVNGNNVVCHLFYPESDKPPRGIDGTSIGFKVSSSYDKLKGTITETFYRDLISRRDNFISEDFMEEAFRISEIGHYILDIKPNLPATLTSTGVRKHGDIPFELSKIREYFYNCNIGWDQDQNNVNVLIWNIIGYITNITFDFGVDFYTLDNINSNPISFNLDYKPTKCEIISINDEIVGEVLDPEFTELYWDLFKIENV